MGTFIVVTVCRYYKTVVFRRFRKALSAVSVILECEARESHTPAGHVSVSHHSPAPFFHSLRPFVRIWSVARVRKKYGCFAVYSEQRQITFM